MQNSISKEKQECSQSDQSTEGSIYNSDITIGEE